MAQGPRSYADAIETWGTHCPRLSVWEDALTDGLIRVAGGKVTLTAAGYGARRPEATNAS